MNTVANRGMYPVGIPGLLAAVLICVGAGAPAATNGLRVPRDFSVLRAAGPPAVVFPMFGAFDDRGALYVAESSGLDLYAELQQQTRRCRVSRLEDRDGDGVFERAGVFADKLVFPMGLAWLEGKLYVADPPDLITLTDADGDGRADERRVILTGFGHTDNGSLHGLIFGPDGWLYMTMGQPDGYRFERPDGTVLSGKSGALLRCRPDGSAVEVVCRGFENLVEIDFMPGGEIIGTDNWFSLPESGERDALVHLLEGGLYPLQLRDQGTPFLVSGEPLPAIRMYPAVALSGMTRYRGSAFPARWRDALFTAQFNARRVVAHRLLRHGSTFRADDEEFLTTDDPDFHPSDVLEATDGSLLVIDTGAWYVHHCPTGRIRKAPAEGGIWRVKSGRAGEAHGRKEASRPGRSELDDLASAASNPEAAARAARALGRRGDKSAEKALLALLARPELPLRLAAAEALAHCGSPDAVPALISALTRETDAFLEHALVHALHRLAGAPALESALSHPHPRVQKAALTLLDQAPHRRLHARAVLNFVTAPDDALQRAALRILHQHPEWAEAALPLVDDLLNRRPATVDNQATLRELVRSFETDVAVQKTVAAALTNAGLTVPQRLFVIETVGRASVSPFPAVWTGALGAILREDDRALRLAVARVASQQKLTALHPALAAVAEQTNAAPELRMEAMRATLNARTPLSGAAFDFLLDQIRPQAPPGARLAAAELLGRARWPDATKDPLRLLALVRNDSILSPSTLLPLLLQAEGADATAAVWSCLIDAAQRGWQPSERELGLLTARASQTGGGRFEEFSALLARRSAGRHEQIQSYLELLTGGDAGRGARWFTEKAGCAACHRVAGQGGLAGPDLTKIGAVRSGRDLIESVVLPSASFAQGYDTFTVTLRDGEELTGVRVRQPDAGFVLRNAGGADIRLRAEEIQDVKRLQLSLMPDGLLNALTRDEIRDLFAYLQSLR